MKYFFTLLNKRCTCILCMLCKLNYDSCTSHIMCCSYVLLYCLLYVQSTICAMLCNHMNVLNYVLRMFIVNARHKFHVLRSLILAWSYFKVCSSWDPENFCLLRVLLCDDFKVKLIFLTILNEKGFEYLTRNFFHK